MTNIEMINIKIGQLIKEIDISSYWSKVGRNYKIVDVIDNNITIDELNELMIGHDLNDEHWKNFYDELKYEMDHKLNKMFIMTNLNTNFNHTISANGLINNFELLT